MPPRGVKKGSKRARQYEHIKRSQKGRGNRRASEIAARTVEKERARTGESRSRSRSSTRGASSSKKYGVKGRSQMTKAQLQRAVDSRK
jgi:hypothetical protein